MSLATDGAHRVQGTLSNSSRMGRTGNPPVTQKHDKTCIMTLRHRSTFSVAWCMVLSLGLTMLSGSFLPAQDTTPPAGGALQPTAPADTESTMPSAALEPLIDEAAPSNPPPEPDVVDEGGAVSPAMEAAADGPSPTETTPVIHGPRDLLPLLGVDQSHWDRILDGRPIHPDEREVLLRLLYVIDRFPIAELHRWAYRQRAFSQFFEEADKSRGEIFALEGRVTRVVVRQPIPELVKRFEFNRYYQCRWIDPSGAEAVVFTRNVPRAWFATPSPIDERASARGLFVKVAGDGPEQPMPVFVADRVAWHPDTLLGRLGMDVGLLDTLVDNQRLSAEESECFYQMLAAAGRAKPGQLAQEARKAVAGGRDAGKQPSADPADEAKSEAIADATPTGYSVVPLFNDPARERGALVDLFGTARSVLRVELDSDDPQGIRERLGFDHYYQISLFTPDSQGNPITVCARNIPEGMPIGEGPRYGEQVRVAGFFLKKWAYRIALPDETQTGPAETDEDLLRKQLAPMIVARDLVWYPPQPPQRSSLGAAIAAVAVIAIVAVFFAVNWRRNRSNLLRARRLASESPGSENLPDKLPGLEDLDRSGD